MESECCNRGEPCKECHCKPGNFAKVLDHGSVELYDFCGSDLKIVNSARVSFNKRHDRLEDKDPSLIKYLMRNGHGTPFEQADFTFVVKCPISVAREWFRHRIASYNEISGRYVQLDPEFYVPDGAFIRSREGRPDEYIFEIIEGQVERDIIRDMMEEVYTSCYNIYEGLMSLGLAKEVARNVLPVGLYTQFFFKINARSLMNFLALRNHDHAMMEIREYAKIIELFFAAKLPITHKAFLECGRKAP